MPKSKSNGSGMMRKRANGTWEFRCSYGTDMSGKPLTKSFYGATQGECRAKKDEYDRKYAVLEKVYTVEQWARRAMS
jgi:hypothetical protein